MSQVNSLAGEQAVGHAAVLAYMLCIRDAGKYAKPEVDPQHYHLSLSLFHTPDSVCLATVFFWLNAKKNTIYLFYFFNFFFVFHFSLSLL